MQRNILTAIAALLVASSFAAGAQADYVSSQLKQYQSGVNPDGQ